MPPLGFGRFRARRENHADDTLAGGPLHPLVDDGYAAGIALGIFIAERPPGTRSAQSFREAPSVAVDAGMRIMRVTGSLYSS